MFNKAKIRSKVKKGVLTCLGDGVIPVARKKMCMEVKPAKMGILYVHRVLMVVAHVHYAGSV